MRDMDGRNAMALCAAIAVLAPIVAPVGVAHAQGNDRGVMDGPRQAITTVADPSDEVNEAFDRAESQICGYDQHSLACQVTVILAIGVPAIFAIRMLAA